MVKISRASDNIHTGSLPWESEGEFDERLRSRQHPEAEYGEGFDDEEPGLETVLREPNRLSWVSRHPYSEHEHTLFDDGPTQEMPEGWDPDTSPIAFYHVGVDRGRRGEGFRWAVGPSGLHERGGYDPTPYVSGTHTTLEGAKQQAVKALWDHVYRGTEGEFPGYSPTPTERFPYGDY